MHIPDWDPAFLSGVDPDEFVNALARSCAQSHVGLFNYPTNIGKQHASLGGSDLVAELIDRCHAHGISVVLYVSVIHDRWASDQNPDWRIIHPNGGSRIAPESVARRLDGQGTWGIAALEKLRCNRTPDTLKSESVCFHNSISTTFGFSFY